MNTLISFPQGPIADDNNNVTLEWRQWFQNPQILTLVIAGNAVVRGDVEIDGNIDIQEVVNLQTLLASIPNLGPSVAKLAMSISSVNVEVAMIPKFNPFPLYQKINNLEVRGMFV